MGGMLKSWAGLAVALMCTSPALADAPIQASDAPQSGTIAAFAQMREDMGRRWQPDCAHGADRVAIDIRFDLAPDGHFAKEPAWINGNGSQAAWAAARLAIAAVKEGEPYTYQPQVLYNIPIVITFDGKSACA